MIYYEILAQAHSSLTVSAQAQPVQLSLIYLKSTMFASKFQAEKSRNSASVNLLNVFYYYITLYIAYLLIYLSLLNGGSYTKTLV